MRTLRYMIFPALAVFVCVLFQARVSADSTTITFEGLADGTDISSTYAPQGVTFTNAVVLTAGESLNELEFPPHSGLNAAFDANGPVTLNFSSTITSFSGYFTYTEQLIVEAFDSSNQLLQSTNSLFDQNFVSSGNAPNEFISLNNKGISSVTITGDPAGGSFVMDDVTFVTTPEPPSLVLLAGAAVFGLILVSIRRSHWERIRGAYSRLA